MQINTILLIINTILTALAPFISSMAYFIKHISRSSCCGSNIILRKPSKSSMNIEHNDV
jgi:hypothetical protein